MLFGTCSSALERHSNFVSFCVWKKAFTDWVCFSCVLCVPVPEFPCEVRLVFCLTHVMNVVVQVCQCIGSILMAEQVLLFFSHVSN